MSALASLRLGYPQDDDTIVESRATHVAPL